MSLWKRWPLDFAVKFTESWTEAQHPLHPFDLIKHFLQHFPHGIFRWRSENR